MTIELNDLPQRLSELRDLLHDGETITLTDSGEPVATVLPQTAPLTNSPMDRLRIFDLHPSGFQPAPDFEDPLPEEFWLGDNT